MFMPVLVLKGNAMFLWEQGAPVVQSREARFSPNVAPPYPGKRVGAKVVL